MTKYVRCVIVTLLVTLVPLTAARAQPGGSPFGFGVGPGQLVNSKTVLADIKATDEQVTKLTEWAKDYQAKSAAALKGLKDLTPMERSERLAARTAEAWKGVGDMLRPDQVRRLKQIELQAAGVVAYSRSDVRDELKLTEDQNEKIREVSREVFKDTAALREEFGVKGPLGGAKLEADKQREFDRKLAAINKGVAGKVEGVLTADQRAKWKEMTGDPIDVAKVQAETRPQFERKKKD